MEETAEVKAKQLFDLFDSGPEGEEVACAVAEDDPELALAFKTLLVDEGKAVPPEIDKAAFAFTSTKPEETAQDQTKSLDNQKEEAQEKDQGKAQEGPRPGFTLIELLVVILIIAILMAAALPFFLSQQEKAVETEAKATLESAYQAASAQQPLENEGYASPELASAIGGQVSDGDDAAAVVAISNLEQVDSEAEDIVYVVESGTSKNDLLLAVPTAFSTFTGTVTDNGPLQITELED